MKYIVRTTIVALIISAEIANSRRLRGLANRVSRAHYRATGEFRCGQHWVQV